MRTVRGEGWAMHLGDCIDVVEPADHTITDPPYGFGAYATDEDAGLVIERLRLYHAAGGRVNVPGHVARVAQEKAPKACQGHRGSQSTTRSPRHAGRKVADRPVTTLPPGGPSRKRLRSTRRHGDVRHG